MKIDFKNKYKSGQMFICPICDMHYPIETDSTSLEGLLCCNCQDIITGKNLRNLLRLYRYEYADFINHKIEPDMAIFCGALFNYKERMKHINKFLEHECILSKTY